MDGLRRRHSARQGRHSRFGQLFGFENYVTVKIVILNYLLCRLSLKHLFIAKI
jgi:hypothetical protein